MIINADEVDKLTETEKAILADEELFKIVSQRMQDKGPTVPRPKRRERHTSKRE